MNLAAIFNEFKSQVAFVLFLVWLLALRQAQDKLLAFSLPLFAVLLMIALDVIYTRLRFNKQSLRSSSLDKPLGHELGAEWFGTAGLKFYWPSASIVTGFLIGLIIDPSESLWIVALAVFAAFVSKQFINVGPRQHIFNPAAFGIMTVALIFGVPVAWWGVAWGKLPLLILIGAMIRILWRMKRLWLPTGFLAVYLVYYLTLFDPQAAVAALIDGSLLLFALVMIPEPITSPSIGNYKYLFGPTVALISIGLAGLNIAEVFLPALLVANLAVFALRHLNKKGGKVAVEGENRGGDQKRTVDDSKKSP